MARSAPNYNGGPRHPKESIEHFPNPEFIRICIHNDGRHAIKAFHFLKSVTYEGEKPPNHPSDNPLNVVQLLDGSLWYWKKGCGWTPTVGEPIPFSGFSKNPLVLKIHNGLPSWISSSTIRSQKYRRSRGSSVNTKFLPQRPPPPTVPRRGMRNRYKPLQTWRGEKVVRRRGKNVPAIVGVVRVSPTNLFFHSLIVNRFDLPEIYVH